MRGGGLEQNNNMPPNLGKSGFGQWTALGGGHYSSHFPFYRFDR